MKLLEVSRLNISYQSRSDEYLAVKNVSFELHEREVVTLVGESGSGKSSIAQAIPRLTDFLLCKVTGTIYFKGINILKASAAQIQQIRKESIGCIFQEPAVALNPVMKVGKQIKEAIRSRDVSIHDLLKKVHFSDPDRILLSYPHQLSGGMKQRVMIAMALAKKPSLLIADEPTTALDVTTQSGIIDLFMELRRSEGLAILFITHDLRIAKSISDRILVMHRGEIVESLEPSDSMRFKSSYAKKLWNAAQAGTKPKAYLDV